MLQLLLVEDNALVREDLASALTAEGYRVVEAADGGTGLEAFERAAPDLVLLDLRLPDVSGFDVCRRLRASSAVPIIIVTAQDDSHDVVAGLEAGADDYVVKPVEPKMLAARIRALMRRVDLDVREALGPDDRASGEVEPRTDGIEVREAEGRVFRDGDEVSLTRTEFRLMCEFVAHPTQVLSREQLLERVWGYDYFGDSRIVDAHIRRLRTKIEPEPDSPRYILTARGLGYRYVE